MALAKRTTAAQRARVVEEFRASGLEQAEFARSRGIKLGTLQGWLYARRRSRPEPAPSARFIEVAPAASSTSAVVLRVGTTSVELADLPPPAWVAELLAALATR